MNLKNIPGRTEAKKRLTHFWTKFLALYKMQEVTRFRRTNFLTENRKSFEEKKCSGTIIFSPGTKLQNYESSVTKSKN